MMMLGSREQLCIHHEVSLLRGSAQNNACRFLCKKGAKRRCTHHSRAAGIIKPCALVQAFITFFHYPGFDVLLLDITYE